MILLLHYPFKKGEACDPYGLDIYNVPRSPVSWRLVMYEKKLKTKLLRREETIVFGKLSIYWYRILWILQSKQLLTTPLNATPTFPVKLVNCTVLEAMQLSLVNETKRVFDSISL